MWKAKKIKKYIDRYDDFQVAVFALMISSSSSQSLGVKSWITLEINIIFTCRDMLPAFPQVHFFHFLSWPPFFKKVFLINCTSACFVLCCYISGGGCGSDEPQWCKGHRFNPRFMCSSCQNDFEQKPEPQHSAETVFVAWLVKTKLHFWEVKDDIECSSSYTQPLLLPFFLEVRFFLQASLRSVVLQAIWVAQGAVKNVYFLDLVVIYIQY